ncbi:MAG TPA: NAD(P)-dependent oxidoreductase [Candidatus Acidoferrales bacterium]|nr:NAD(P)-dependent oxidoreductase [Candidatus Acidoferrales bacterium]
MSHPLAADLDHILEHTEELWNAARGARVFITGGTGFVGTWLTESLLWAHHRLGLGLSAVLLTRNPEGFRARSPHLASDPAITLLAGDAAGFTPPEGSFAFAIHAATERYTAPDVQRPADILDCDLAATRRVLEFARSSRVQRLLFTSSGAVYGKQPPDLPNIPEDYCGAPQPCDTSSAYGAGKRISEYLCACYFQVYGIEATIARLFAFIGPHLALDANYAAGNFLRDAMSGGPIRIAGDGTPFRSYLYAADLAIWLWTILFRGTPARPYNVGSPEPVSILELARAISREVSPGAQICVAQQAVHGAPAARYVPSTERAERELDLRVRIPLDEAIRRTHRWYHRYA